MLFKIEEPIEDLREEIVDHPLLDVFLKFAEEWKTKLDNPYQLASHWNCFLMARPDLHKQKYGFSLFCPPRERH